MRLAFDIETDGLLRELTKIHCLVAQDLDTGEVFKYDTIQGNIYDGIELLAVADELWGHNVIAFDIEAIKELYPDFQYRGKVYDTLILSRLFFTDILNRDFRSKPANMPANLYGRHSLESWGHRLGQHKSEFGKQLNGDWSNYSPEMLEYCAQDVVVSVALVKLFEPKLTEYSKCIDLEHSVAFYMSQQEKHGFPFDIERAHTLELELRTELMSLQDRMRSTFNYVDGGSFTPKRPNKEKGYVAGAEFCKLKEFNPTSRQHIAWAFKTHRGWKPTEFTNTGIPKIDEGVLKDIGTPEALGFARILELQKHLGQLSEGANAWLKKVEKDGNLHHSCVLNTNTGRMAHMRPNLAQVPSAPEYRALFHPGPNRIQVGCDASGLELRCLGHYLSRFDGGKFAKEVVEGDIHSQLAAIYGTDRKTSKGVTYCLIYGGGNTKLGETAKAPKGSEAKVGGSIRKKVLEGLEGFKQLNEAIKKRAESGVLKGLDGRPIRLQGKNHAALNYLLQSAGSIITKTWLVEAYKRLEAAGIDFIPLAYIHDEVQLSVLPEHAEKASEILIQAMKDTTETLKFRCDLDAEAQIGSNWSEVH